MSDSQQDFSKEVSAGKNMRTIKCKYCTSVILEPATGDYIEFEFDLPTITQKVQQPTTTTESIKSFWEVADMFTFANVGFSNTVQNNKFLTCADCDVGPIGYHDLTTKKSYVALSRVEYKD